MRHALWFQFALAVALLSAAGCGRTGLGERCASDGDCRNGFFCADGFCALEEDPQTNNGTNNGTSGTNNETSGSNNQNNMSCFENDEGVCVFEPPCDGGGDCLPAMLCDVGCPPNTIQDGCDCVNSACVGSVDCPDGYICLDRQCSMCSTDDQCARGFICSEGLCVADAACESDADCGSAERCVAGICRDRPACVFDADCPSGQLCFNGRCTVSDECQVDLDCPMGQECVGGNCFEALCRGPEDCEEGELCDAGVCVPPPPVGTCIVATQSALITDGQRIPLEAFAYDAQGQAVAATFQWQSSDPGVARVVPGPNALGGTDAGTAAFTATTSEGIPCMGEAVFTNPGVVQMGDLRVVVHDIESGAPVAGATVQVGNQSVQTDAAGVALLNAPGGAYVVSVFHDDFNYLTVRDISETDVRLPLMRRGGDGPIGGFTGEFDTSQLHSSGNITLGLAGASIAGGTLELDLQRLLGDTFVSPLEIPGVVDEQIPLPGGIIAYGGAFGFNATIKETYYAQATGGPRIAWGLAGQLPFGELLDFFQGGGFEGGEILAQILPLFNRFDHGSYPDVFAEIPRVVDTVDIDADGDTSEILPDYANFPVINMTPAVRQNLVTDVAISNFPLLNNEEPGLAILVGGVVLPSPGFVPTGISATSDENGDGRPDLQRLSIAPGYGPLVGGRYSILAITFAGGGGGGQGPGGFELPQEFSVSLWNGQNFPTAVSLGTFPDSSETILRTNTRTVVVTSSAGPMYRVRMVGDDRSWDVWSVGPVGNMGQFGNTIQVPAVPAGRQDLFTSGSIYVDAIQTNSNLDDLVGASGIGLRNAGLVSSAYNRTLVR